MKRAAVAVLALVCVIFVTSCADEDSAEDLADTSPSPETTTTPSPEREAPELAAAGETVEVSGQANVFAAGRSESLLGAAGGGEMPPGWQLPDSARVVVFQKVRGGVAHIPGAGEEEATGRDLGETDVDSYEGISGIIHRSNIMFLVGVFLTDEPPSGSSPPRLNVTKLPKGDKIAPRIGQVFYIGDGTRYTYTIPEGATRLYVGFADACHPFIFVDPPAVTPITRASYRQRSRRADIKLCSRSRPAFRDHAFRIRPRAVVLGRLPRGRPGQSVFRV